VPLPDGICTAEMQQVVDEFPAFGFMGKSPSDRRVRDCWRNVTITPTTGL